MMNLKSSMHLLRISVLFFSLIFLPLSSMATLTYTVKSGDSLWSIAASHRPTKHISVHGMICAIQAMNGPLMEDSSSISVGQNLILPSTEDEIKAALAKTTQATQITQITQITQTPLPVVTKVAPVTASAIATGLTTEKSTEQSMVSPVQQTPVSTNSVAVQSVLQSSPVPLSISTASEAQSSNSSSPAAPAVQESSNSSSNFPWGWLFIVVLLLAFAYLLCYRKFEVSLPQEIKRLAALRLGISSRRQEPVITRYKTKHFKEALSAESDLQENNHASPYSHASAEAMATAMIDISEMNYDGAERLLQNAISQDPENLELRLKLLELYITTDNRVAFKKEAEHLENKVPENSPLWHQVRGMYLNQWAYDSQSSS